MMKKELIPFMMTKLPASAPAPLSELSEVAVKEIVETTDTNAKKSTYAVQIRANVVWSNVPIVIVMTK